MKDDKRINQDEKRGSEIIPESRLPKLMSEICDLAINDLNAMFVELLTEVETSFFTLADQAESDEDQSLYFHSMTQIQNRRSNAEAKFSACLAKALIILLNTELQLPLDNIQLNSQDAEDSRIKVIVDKANADNQAQLWQITSRFDILLSNVSLTLANNPLSPLSICNVFVESVGLFELQMKANLSLYDLFERSLIRKINLVYKKLNTTLTNNGVLPNLASYSPKQKALNIDTEFNDSMGTLSSESNIDSGANLLEALIVLRKENPSLFNKYSSVAAAKVSTIDIKQLITALTKIQETIQDSVEPSIIETEELEKGNFTKSSNEIRKHLENAKLSSNINSGQLFDQKTNDVIAGISMLFDFIAHDNNLPNEFKILINKLQVPLLKVALMDASFLTKGNHPARTLLNELAEAGVGWSRGGGVGLKDKAEEIVDKIINEFGHDITVFTHCLLDFQTFTVQHKKRAFLIERRLQEAELGKAKNDTAKLKASQAIEDIIGGKVLPETLTQLIEEDWKSVMLLTYLRSGDDNEVWNKNIQTAKDLIDVMSLREETGVAVSSQLSDIADDIKRSLNVLDYGDYENAKLFQELQQLHERVQQGEEVVSDSSLQNDFDILPFIESEVLPDNEVINYSDLPLPIVEEISSIEINKAEHFESKNESVLSIVDSLKPGNWFELEFKEKRVRCKLAAIITSINKYIFVDYTGKKLAEYSKPHLVQAFKEQKISQLDEGTLFERAFKSISDSNNDPSI
jgi:hypothetical protein